MRRLVVLVSLLASLTVACSDDAEPASTAGGDTTTSSTATSEAPTSSESTTSTTSTSTAPGPDGLPGEVIEIFPYEGANLGVVGVAVGDTLNVRSGPGVEFDVVLELDPLHKGISATGHNRDLGDAIWAEIETEGATGWANTRYMLQPGGVSDLTAQLFPGELPAAPTMEALGEAVAAEVASEEPPSDIVVVDGPIVGDLGEITVDVLGLGDDAQGGWRLHVFGAPHDSGDGFVLRTVEATALCTRGVDGEACL